MKTFTFWTFIGLILYGAISLDSIMNAAETRESSFEADAFFPKRQCVKAAELTADEVKLIELTNAERKKLQLPPLQPDPVLMKLARAHSANMAKLDQIGHELEGKTFSQRTEQASYQALRAGENVAQGQRTPAEAVAGWMQSPGHKDNILQAEYTHIGVGMATSKSGKPYFTQVFAKPFARPK